MTGSSFLCILLFVFNSITIFSNAEVLMGIDLGSYAMKIAVVGRGKPLDVALNKDSDRKTPTAVGLLDHVRYFGRSASQLALRQPDHVFQDFIMLIGKDADHPNVKVYKERYPYHKLDYNVTTGQLFFSHPSGVSLTIEELVAMLLEHAEDIAEHHSGDKVQACIIAVPHFFTQAERRSLLNAAKLVNLNILQLINTDTAVALNLGVFLPQAFNPMPQHYVLFNMGATSTSTTVFSFHSGQHRDGKAGDKNSILTVKGVGYDPTLGTSSFVGRLIDHMVKHFQANKKIAKGDITQNQRSMALLGEEARRVFVKLSANNQITAQVNELFEDEDFKMKISRTELEELCSDLKERLKRPFETALQMANITMDLVQEVIPMGGGTRIPMVSTFLKTASGKLELSKRVNADEAAVLGAVYQATLSLPGIRAVRIFIKDVVNLPIGIDFERAPDAQAAGDKPAGDSTPEAAAASNNVRRVLFNRGNYYPQKRSITFNRHSSGFEFYVGYVISQESDAAYIATPNISKVEVLGVAESIARNAHAESRGVKAHFVIDSSGLLQLTSIESLFHPANQSDAKATTGKESTFQKIGKTISGFFGGNAENATTDGELPAESANETNQEKPTVVNTTDSAESPGSEPTTGTGAKEEIPPPPKPPSPFSESLEFVASHLDKPVQSDEQVQTSIDLIQRLRANDLAKEALEHAVNELESYIFHLRDQVESDIFKLHASSDDLDQLIKLSGEYSDWYEEEQGSSTPIEEYQTRITTLKNLIDPIELRMREAEGRPGEFKELESTIADAEKFFESMPKVSETMKNLTEQLRNQMESLRSKTPSLADSENKTKEELYPWNEVFTSGETESLKKEITDAKTWLKESRKKLEKALPNEDPVVFVDEIRTKKADVARRVEYLGNKLRMRQSEMARLLQMSESLMKAAKEAEKAAEQKAAENKTKVETGEASPTDAEAAVPGDVDQDQEQSNDTVTTKGKHEEL